MSVLADGLRMSVGTLTALPVRPPSRVDRGVAGASMVLAPLPGLLLGLVVAAVVLGGDAAGLPPLVVGGLGIGALALATRGLHLDGLADTADGLAASYDRARAWEVMRRGDVGPAGAATLVLVLLVQAAALAALLDAAAGPAAAGVLALAAVVGSRSVLPLACARGLPAARPEGLGAAVAGSVQRRVAVVVALVVLGAVAGAASMGGLGPWRPLLAVLVGWVVAAVVLRRCVRRLGGVSGDVLGAAVESALAAGLVVLTL